MKELKLIICFTLFFVISSCSTIFEDRYSKIYIASGYDYKIEILQDDIKYKTYSNSKINVDNKKSLTIRSDEECLIGESKIQKKRKSKWFFFNLIFNFSSLPFALRV